MHPSVVGVADQTCQDACFRSVDQYALPTLLVISCKKTACLEFDYVQRHVEFYALHGVRNPEKINCLDIDTLFLTMNQIQCSLPICHTTLPPRPILVSSLRPHTSHSHILLGYQR